MEDNGIHMALNQSLAYKQNREPCKLWGSENVPPANLKRSVLFVTFQHQHSQNCHHIQPHHIDPINTVYHAHIDGEQNRITYRILQSIWMVWPEESRGRQTFARDWCKHLILHVFILRTESSTAAIDEIPHPQLATRFPRASTPCYPCAASSAVEKRTPNMPLRWQPPPQRWDCMVAMGTGRTRAPRVPNTWRMRQPSLMQWPGSRWYTEGTIGIHRWCAHEPHASGLFFLVSRIF